MILLDTWTTPFGLAPFDKISDVEFAPAMDQALEVALAGIAKIADNLDAPTFENTIEAQEVAETLLDQVASVFYTVVGSNSTAEREVLQREFAPKLSAYSSAVSSNQKLFYRIEALWSQRDALKLTAEQERVLMLMRRSFVRAGAQLTGVDAERMTQIRSRLASLGTKFTQNLLADEREWFLPLAETDLAGLPDFAIATARAAGLGKEVDGPVVTCRVR
jgi:peptidyl-dipeptidase Dcp